eukprot:bmy_21748T0
MMCFSDYPIPDHYPNFMHNSQVLEYFRMYANEFDLLKYIRFKTIVCCVKKQPDFSTSGQWEVVTESEGKKEVNVFDGVMELRSSKDNTFIVEIIRIQRVSLERVIIIGTGNSGSYLAVEISHTAKQKKEKTYLLLLLLCVFTTSNVSHHRMDTSSCRNVQSSELQRYTWLNATLKELTSLLSNKKTGSTMSRRKKTDDSVTLQSHEFPVGDHFDVFLSTRKGAWIFNRVGDYGYPFDVLLTSRFQYFMKKICGQSLANTFLEKKMNQRFDHEMFGLKPKHRALSQQPTINDDLPNCIISGLVKPTLAIIGLIQPLGAIMPVSELHGHWVTQIFK